jgi:hypothetical protein
LRFLRIEVSRNEGFVVLRFVSFKESRFRSLVKVLVKLLNFLGFKVSGFESFKVAEIKFSKFQSFRVS